MTLTSVPATVLHLVPLVATADQTAAAATDVSAALDRLLTAQPQAVFNAATADLARGDGQYTALSALVASQTVGGTDLNISVSVVDATADLAGAGYADVENLLSLGVAVGPPTANVEYVANINVVYTLGSADGSLLPAHAITNATYSRHDFGLPDVNDYIVAVGAVGFDSTALASSLLTPFVASDANPSATPADPSAPAATPAIALASTTQPTNPPPSVGEAIGKAIGDQIKQAGDLIGQGLNGVGEGVQTIGKGVQQIGDGVGKIHDGLKKLIPFLP